MIVVSVLSASFLHDVIAMARIKSFVVFSFLAISLSSAVVCPVKADDDDDLDHEIARKALSEGRIRPLTEIMATLKSQFQGQIVGVELEAKAVNTFIYEFKVLTPEGKLKEVKVDAATAKIVKIEDDD